jgi:hypothetical protein
MAKQNRGGAYESDVQIPWSIGDVSSDGGEGDGPLSVDDGGVHQADGAVSADHAVGQRQYNKSSGFSQPVDDSGKDWGPADMGSADHIDGSITRPDWAPVTKERSSDSSVTDRPLNASTARVKKVSSDEYFPDTPYGYPAKRGGDDYDDLPSMNAHLDGAERPKRSK